MAGWSVVAKVESGTNGEWFTDDVTILVSAETLAEVNQRASAYFKKNKPLDAEDAVIKSAERLSEVVISEGGLPV